MMAPWKVANLMEAVSTADGASGAKSETLETVGKGSRTQKRRRRMPWFNLAQKFIIAYTSGFLGQSTSVELLGARPTL